MTPGDSLDLIRAELEVGIVSQKCRKCSCMLSALDGLSTVLPSIGTAPTFNLAEWISGNLNKMYPIQYDCLGCEHCYPAVALNALDQAFPSVSDEMANLSCDFRVRDENWPPVAGEYYVLDSTAPVAVSTLASVELADALARRKPDGLAIVGKTETENIGLDKVIMNVVTSPTLRYLIVAGIDSEGHLAGQSLLALAENGVDEQRCVIGSLAKRSVLRNVSDSEIQAFRAQVQVIDMIGCNDPEQILLRIEDLSQHDTEPCGCSQCSDRNPISRVFTPKKLATEPAGEVKLDRAGYFVIIPVADKSMITVEHYAYDHSLIRIIEGTTARAICNTIISNGWVTELTHAAYLGKELNKAELSLLHGFKFVQDGA